LYNHLSVGLQAGLIHKSLDLGSYTYNNQYSTANGGGFDTDLPTGETFSSSTVIMPQLNMGVLYYNSNDQKLINPFGGFALFHILSPKESFTGIDNRLPRRWVLHGGANFNVSDEIMVTPKFVYMRQANATELLFTVLGYYKIPDMGITAILGGSYRNQDAAILHLGAIYKDFTVRVSYDVNTSTLNTVSNNKGGFEVSVVYQKPKPRRLPSMD